MGMVSIQRSRHIQGAAQEVTLALPLGLKPSAPRGQVGVAFLSLFSASFQKDKTLDTTPTRSLSNLIQFL